MHHIAPLHYCPSTYPKVHWRFLELIFELLMSIPSRSNVNRSVSSCTNSVMTAVDHLRSFSFALCRLCITGSTCSRAFWCISVLWRGFVVVLGLFLYFTALGIVKSFFQSNDLRSVAERSASATKGASLTVYVFSPKTELFGYGITHFGYSQPKTIGLKAFNSRWPSE
jgi:hypothetical protein